MELRVYPAKRLQGVVMPPASKSHSVRALLLALLGEGKSYLQNVLDADDTRAALNVCKKLGAQIKIHKNTDGGLDITLHSSGVPLRVRTDRKSVIQEIFTASSGITTTFIIPILGLRENPGQMELSCSRQMMKRPLGSIIQAVNTLGMEAVSIKKNGSCPLKISGKLKGGKAKVDGENSQYLSALLMSLPCAQKSSIIEVENLKERPYADMTLHWLDGQNIRYSHRKKERKDIFEILGNQKYHPFNKIIPGDFSSASYLIAAAVLLPGSVTLRGLNMDDPQGDKRFISILRQMGADISIKKSSNGHVLKIQGGKPLKGIIIDANDIPDMLPTLAVLATRAKGKTTIMNVGNARIKETDRIKSMAAELNKMGVRVEEKPSSLIIHKSKLRAPKNSAHIHGYSDHRTIMAIAVAGLLADKPITIDTAEGLNKTFPNFLEIMNSIGAKMEKISNPKIVLIGFKNTGKSTVGKALAKKIKRQFLDLDDKIKDAHNAAGKEKISCRQIMEKYGENYFRKLEHKVFLEVMEMKEPIVLALGGGTPMLRENRAILSRHIVIEISAPQSVVFERIMKTGRPAIFAKDEVPFESFRKLWAERSPMYRKLANHSIKNNGEVNEAVAEILKKLVI